MGKFPLGRPHPGLWGLILPWQSLSIIFSVFFSFIPILFETSERADRALWTRPIFALRWKPFVVAQRTSKTTKTRQNFWFFRFRHAPVRYLFFFSSHNYDLGPFRIRYEIVIIGIFHQKLMSAKFEENFYLKNMKIFLIWITSGKWTM